ncbi:MAG: NosD domain-containing protein, partial [Candidatus Electryonea clarkiae]|nr:NosD domain-containing protein [Candidatus Electryonea clarkiae]
MSARTFLIEIIRCISIFVLFLTCSSLAYPDIIYVPDDFETIQSAIDASLSGDTVLIYEDQYEEELLIEGHGITLASEFLLDDDTTSISSTILSGDSLFRPVSIESTGEDTVKIIGLTFTYGYAAQQDTGSAVSAENTILLIDHCMLLYNRSIWEGGALYAVGSEVFLSNNIFSHNYAFRRAAAKINNCRGWIRDNRVGNNTAANHFGGISITNNSNFDVENNVFIQNSSGGLAGGLQINGSTANIVNNVFIDNSTASYGGGIDAVNVTSLLVENNIFRGNHAGRMAGGLSVSGDNIIIRGNLFENNSASSWDQPYRMWRGIGGGVYVVSFSGSVEISNNTFIANVAAAYGGALYTGDSLYFHHNIISNNRSPIGSALFGLTGTLPFVEGHDNLFVNNHPAYEFGDHYLGAVLPGNNTTFEFYNNDFINNDGVAAGIANNAVFDARNNYWGDPSGPYHEDDNPEGGGDSVDPGVQI